MVMVKLPAFFLSPIRYGLDILIFTGRYPIKLPEFTYEIIVGATFDPFGYFLHSNTGGGCQQE
jgi:hypothetical protein